MAQESLHEKEQLEKLEQAAAQTSRPEQRPEQIAREASQVEAERRSGLAWALPYFIAAAAAGVGLAVVEWNPSLIHMSALATEKAQRYTAGALGVAIVMAIARAVEIYWIA